MFVWPLAFLTEPGSARYSSAPSITTVWSNYQTSYNDYTLKSITKIRWLYHQMFKRCFHQLNSLNVNHVTNHSSFSLVNLLVADVTVKVGYKYVNIHRHQLFIYSKINNGWLVTVTVLQRKASMQQIGVLLVPAIKGGVYINTHYI